MKKILISIDDTDDLESIGTGELLENMCRELEREGFGTGGFVTRHQLYICDEIAYTSHNSSMCCEFECSKNLDDLLVYAKRFLEENSAEGSDPGLCVILCGIEMPDVTEFGKMAQQRVLTKKEAYDTASKYPGAVFLSEHGGTGDGIIGALAGAGLRLTGNDGRVKGKIYPKEGGEIISVSDACSMYGLGQVCDEMSGERLKECEMIRFEGPTKAIFKDGLVTLPVNKVQDVWVPKPKSGKGRQKK